MATIRKSYVDYVNRIIKSVIKTEGGFVIDPDDSGGATNFGITLNTAKQWGVDIDGDRKTTVRDIKLLTNEKALELYREKLYWPLPIRWLVPPRLDYTIGAPPIKPVENFHTALFDCVVHSGERRAFRILQNTINGVGAGYISRIDEDGRVGVKTKNAFYSLFLPFKDNEKMMEGTIDLFTTCYCLRRRNFLIELATRRPKDRKYCVTRRGNKGGWIKRVEKFMLPEWRLTNVEFSSIKKGWGK